MFDGTTKKLKDWFRQMDTFFILRGGEFTTEESRVLTAYQFCRGGTAGEWAKFCATQYLLARSNQSYQQDMVHWTWTDLKEAMIQRFGDRYEQETARAKIYAAQQGSMKIEQYIAVFEQYIPDANLQQDILVQHLLGGINNEIWEIIQTQPLPKDLESLKDVLKTAEKNWVDRQLALQHRHQQQRRKFEKKDQKKQGTHGFKDNYFQNTRQEQPYSKSQPVARQQAYSQPPPRPEPLHPGEPMDIDRMRAQQARGQSAKPRFQKKPGQQKGVCYRCGKPGHFANKCTVKQVNEMATEHLQEIAAMWLEQEHDQTEDHEDLAEDSQAFSLDAPYGQDESYFENDVDGGNIDSGFY